MMMFDLLISHSSNDYSPSQQKGLEYVTQSPALTPAFLASTSYAIDSISGYDSNSPMMINKIDNLKYLIYTPIISILIVLGIFGNCCIIAVCCLQKTLSTGYT
ncbi:unnamed protein product [Gordionus sp. m RMFG-2023]